MMPHEDFLRELYALCQKHGVHLDGTEDEGVLVVPNDDPDGDDGSLRPEKFAFFTCDGDGAIRCFPAKLGEWGGLVPDYDVMVRMPQNERR